MKNIKIGILSLGLMAFGLSSCATTNQAENNQEKTTNLSLFGSWTLTDIKGHKMNEAFPSKTPAITFEPITKKFTGNSGCNNIFGSFTTSNNHISFGNAASTKMYCEGVNEDAFLSAFNSVTSYTIKGNTLTLLDSNQQTVLKFMKK
ncbi:META domain-containing protein [Vaginella massiliensis]|uniref:META domain-containing protein n=1 Tax=Vaginella massiliensis TaxID=1816680 RepID=UPI0008384362|nr:META domain-containing protein [Vaginella massiliensis]